MKIALWICLMALLAVIMACGDSPTATPTQQPPTGTPQRPVANISPTPTQQPPTDTPQRPVANISPTPTQQPPTDTPQRPVAGITPGHPVASLAILPPGNWLMFVNLETLTQRPAFREYVEFELDHFVNMDEIPLAQELLRSIGADAIALSSPYNRYEWACVLKGDFTRVQGALRQAAEAGTGLSATTIETHRQVEIFALVRKRAISESEVYMAVLDQETLAVSPDLDAVREMTDRWQDGLSLPQPLAVMLQDWGLPDYLQGAEVGSDSSDVQSRPIDAVKFQALHATLAQDATTTLRLILYFDDEDQAAAAAAWLGEQEGPHMRNIGYGSGAQIDQWRVRGTTVYAEATVPDEDVPDLVVPD